MTERLTLHLMRHGAPLKTGLLLGHQDMPSTQQGEAQICAQAAILSFDRLIASDLIRCANPAKKIATSNGAPLTLDARWRELNFGEWDGLPPAEINSERLAQFWQDPDAYAPPQGETLSALSQRVGAALRNLTAGSALIITHGGAIRAALHHLLGWPHPQCWSIALPYAVRLTITLWRDEQSSTGWRGQLEALQP
jgi:alpha-ribazole phosphatase